jgi:hypothetical protein
MKVLILIAMLLSLSACAIQKMDKGVPYLVGLDKITAVDFLGKPNKTGSIEGKNIEVLAWEYNNHRSVTTPVNSHTSTNVSVYGDVRAHGTINSTTTTYLPTMTHDYCKIEIFINDDNIVEDARYTGNNDGCGHYYGKMRAIINHVEK